MGRQYNHGADGDKEGIESTIMGVKSAKYLFSHWNKIKAAIKGKFVYIFLDFDGTLAPIAKTPGAAFIPRETRRLLLALSGMPNCKLAIVSGRALKDVEKKVGIKNRIVFVGNHGFEIKGPEIKFRSPVEPEYMKLLKKIRVRLEKNLSSVKGVFTEDKGFSLSLHYRAADRNDVPKIRAEFYAAIVSCEAKKKVSVITGKKILEIRPPVAWDKGKAVLWLLARHKSGARYKKKEVVPVYIGDDKTDEDAFKSLKGKAITIFVGRALNTKARFYLKDTPEVTDFLKVALKNMN